MIIICETYLCTVRSNTLRCGVGDQRGDQERDGGVVREGRDQGEGGRLLSYHLMNDASANDCLPLQIELEQILGLNQDLAPSNYITADVPSKVQKVSQSESLPSPSLSPVHIKGVARNIVPFLC